MNVRSARGETNKFPRIEHPRKLQALSDAHRIRGELDRRKTTLRRNADG
jgi:hypothetical protein